MEETISERKVDACNCSTCVRLGCNYRDKFQRLPREVVDGVGGGLGLCYRLQELLKGGDKQ